ncbi:Uncharacterised protein [Mycobacteroides abscessus subsp. massiliense]|nr:Uncharacterised protein [Mycobacteroides abscessus subsp. massiliense]
MFEALLELIQLDQGLFDFLFLADDADQVVHGLLQVGVQCVRIFGTLGRRVAEGRQRQGGSLVDVGLGDLWAGSESLDVVGGSQTGAPSEHQQVGKGVAAQPV